MPTLGAALDFAKLEARNIRAHQLGTAPASPVTGQFYFNTGDNTLYWYDGSAWVSARGGVAAVPPATTGALGTIQLAGDLAGTATSPQIAAGAIVLADHAASMIDAANATASLRTLGYSAGKAIPGDATLDVINMPTAPVSFNNQRLSNVPTPNNPTDAANKTYVDSVAQGLDAKASVRLVATSSVGAGTNPGGPQNVDGIAVAANDRVLLTAQTDPTFNGIWGVSLGGSWGRTLDADAWTELPGAYVWVEEGTTNQDSGWVCTVNAGGTLGTTPITWTQFSGAGQITAGAGLTKTGNTIDVGVGAGLSLAADSISVATNGITNAMIADGAINLASADVTGTLPIAQGGTSATDNRTARTFLQAAGWYGNGGTHAAGTTITILQSTHQLRTGRGILVQVVDAASGNVELADVNINTTGDVTITFGASVAANSKLITLVG